MLDFLRSGYSVSCRRLFSKLGATPAGALANKGVKIAGLLAGWMIIGAAFAAAPADKGVNLAITALEAAIEAGNGEESAAALRLLEASVARLEKAAKSEQSASVDLEAAIAAWIKSHPDAIVAAVNSYMAEQRAANQPKLEDFRAREPEIFGGGVSVGPDDAKAELVIFADFNCGFCRKAQPMLATLRAAHPDLKIVYRDFPILSPLSIMAARAARAVGMQGKYLAFHDALYETDRFSEADLWRIAGELSLDVEALKRDAGSPQVIDAVEKDAALARSLKIGGTPFFYLRGHDRLMPGLVPIDEMTRAITQARMTAEGRR
jgi:protein-disulfide isomerase